MLDRWLSSKLSKKHFRSVLDIFRCYVGCDTFEALLEIGEPRDAVLRARVRVSVCVLLRKGVNSF